MKMERISLDKIRIFLTFDDLTERGIQKDDMWREIPKVHELFSDMMDQAYSELGFDPTGQLAVEVFALPAQGMVVIVTKTKSAAHDLDQDDLEDDTYEMEVIVEEAEHVSYVFHDFEDLLRLAKVLHPLMPHGGSLYTYKGKYILQFVTEEMDDKDDQYDNWIAVLSEYGEAATVTQAVLEEYGKTIIAEHALEVLCKHFRN